MTRKFIFKEVSVCFLFFFFFFVSVVINKLPLLFSSSAWDCFCQDLSNNFVTSTSVVSSFFWQPDILGLWGRLVYCGSKSNFPLLANFQISLFFFFFGKSRYWILHVLSFSWCFFHSGTRWKNKYWVWSLQQSLGETSPETKPACVVLHRSQNNTELLECFQNTTVFEDYHTITSAG